MTLASQIKGDGIEPALTLPASAIEMLEWDRIDRIFYEVTTTEHGRIFGNAFLPRPPTAQVNEPTYYDGTVGQLAVRLSAVTIHTPSSGGEAATVVVAETLAKRNAVVRSIMITIVPIEAGLLLLAGLTIWIAVSSTLRSVDRLTVDLARIQPDRLKPLESSPAIPREIVPLVDALNGLIERVVEGRNTLQRFVANAAHQLRTPLAALQLQTQRALRETDPVRRQEALTAVDKGMQRLAHLTQQLLTLARAEPTDAAASEQRQPVDLALVARQEVERWVDRAIALGIDLGYEGEGSGILVRGDQELLAELIGNLVDNGIRYGKSGGRITVRLAASPVILSVEDDGPGIPAAERTHVLERFYRLPASIGSGSGLGLAIANEIAARHEARLEIGAGEDGVGTIVTVMFSHKAALG
jgi:two-component system sensor histidine kinase TctE